MYLQNSNNLQLGYKTEREFQGYLETAEIAEWLKCSMYV